MLFSVRIKVRKAQNPAKCANAGQYKQASPKGRQRQAVPSSDEFYQDQFNLTGKVLKEPGESKPHGTTHHLHVLIVANGEGRPSKVEETALLARLCIFKPVM